MERCLKSSFKVWGKSARPFTLDFDEEGIPRCTCMSFQAMSQHGKPWCAHLEGQIEKICNWEGEPLVPGYCLSCSGPTEVVDEQQ